MKPPITTAKQAVKPVIRSKSHRSHWSPGSNKTPTPSCQTSTQAGEPVSKHPVNCTVCCLPPCNKNPNSHLTWLKEQSMPGSPRARPSCPALSTKAHTANERVLPQGAKSAWSPAGRKKSGLSLIWVIAFTGRWSFSSQSGCRWPGRSDRIASTPPPHAVAGREPLRVPRYRAFEGGQMCHGVASLCTDPALACCPWSQVIGTRTLSSNPEL